MQADFIGFCGQPSQVQTLWSVWDGANRIFPVEAGNKVAAGVADDGDIQFSHQIHYITAKTLRVCCGVAGFINAAIDAAAQMFDKVSVQAFVDSPDGIITVELHACFFHAAYSFKIYQIAVNSLGLS